MLVSPIPVTTLLAYFSITEEELLLRKARVEVAIHEWVLETSKEVLPTTTRAHGILLSLRRKVRPPAVVPEWKRERPRAGRAWDPEEDAALLRDYDIGLPLEAIAKRLGRGVFGVEVRLCKLGRIAFRLSQSIIKADSGATE